MSEVPFNERPLIITDVETTGLNPKLHQIIEIGALKVDQHDLGIIDVFDLRIRVPETCIQAAEPEALKVNGYNADDWAFAMPYADVAVKFEQFSANGILTAWSVKFEYSFLSGLWEAAKLPTNPIEHFRYTFDLPSMVWFAMPGLESLHKDDIADKLGIEPERKPHRGVYGALHELQILKALRKSR